MTLPEISHTEQPDYPTYDLNVPAIVRADKQLSPTDVYLVSLIHALDKQQNCFASNTFLAEQIGRTPGTIAVSLVKLKKLGWVVEVTGEGRRRLRTTVVERQDAQVLAKSNSHRHRSMTGASKPRSESPKTHQNRLIDVNSGLTDVNRGLIDVNLSGYQTLTGGLTDVNIDLIDDLKDELRKEKNKKKKRAQQLAPQAPSSPPPPLNEICKEQSPLPDHFFSSTGPQSPEMEEGALKVYSRYFPSYHPTVFQLDTILTTVTDLVTWSAACKIWALRGYQPRNIRGLLETYESEVKNKKSPPKPKLAATAVVYNDPCPHCSSGSEDRCPSKRFYGVCRN